MSGSVALAIRRLIVHTGRTGPPALWKLGYEAALRGLTALLCAGVRDASVYARGSLATGHVLAGHSDIDAAIVTTARREVVARRWERLARRVPGLAMLVDMAVYDDEELRLALRANTLTATEPVHLGHPSRDEAGLRIRPGLGAPWRLVTGPERRPAPLPAEAQERRLAAWLELQFVWRCAFGAAVRRDAADVPYMAVKAVADPIRIWLHLDGERCDDRGDALRRGLDLFPDEEPALRVAQALHDGLHSAAGDGLRLTLPALVRLSQRLGARVTDEVAAAGTTEVALRWDAGAPLAVRDDAPDAIAALTGARPRLLPLADWRARVWPLYPDDALAAVDLDPGDPSQLAAAARAAGDYGPYPALRRDGVLVLPGPGLLRAAQVAVTDPVSFALLEGRSAASFPEVAGWSAADSARRALGEHRAWLGTDGRDPRTWLEGQARATVREVYSLCILFSAARAALFASSLAEGAPELCVTLEAVGRALGAEEEYAALRQARRHGSRPPAKVLRAMRARVLELSVLRYDTRAVPC